MTNGYEIPKNHRPHTPGGLLMKKNVRRFTPDLFNDENDHNPIVAQLCKRCNGDGGYRVYKPEPHDVTCKKCKGVGAFEKAVPYFPEKSKEIAIIPNDGGYIKCPKCGKRFPITSNQYWTGKRHECGQKLKLEGPNAAQCWTKKKE